MSQESATSEASSAKDDEKVNEDAEAANTREGTAVKDE